MMKHSGRREWTKLAVVKAMLWWILGLTLLSCAGWMWNGLILLAIELAKSVGLLEEPFRVNHFAHNVFCGMGYFGTLLLWGLLWYQNPLNANSLEDVETKFGMFKIVWIRRQRKDLKCERGDQQSTAVPAKNHPVFPYCREMVLILLTAFCLVFGTWLISGLTQCD